MLLSALRDVLWQPALEVLSQESKCQLYTSIIDETAKLVARNLDRRESAVAAINKEHLQSIWDRLTRYWEVLANRFYPDRLPLAISEQSLIGLTFSLAKLERNLIAGLRGHQASAIPHEECIRTVIFHITTFTRIEDPNFFALQIVMVQLLSNLISPVSNLSQDHETTNLKFQQYLHGGQREDDIIIRLLDSQEPKVNISTLQLLYNLVRNDELRQRELLVPRGLQWIARILGRMDDWLESDDGRFEVAYNIFSEIISNSLHPNLFGSLSIPTEPITPSQTSLLKILDSTLLKAHDNPSESPNTFLIPLFRSLADYAIFSMKGGVDDGRLPKILEALVLCGECLCHIGLSVQSRKDHKEESIGGEEIMIMDVKSEGGLVKPAVDTLKQLTEFMPRLKRDPANPVSTTAPTERSLSGIKVTLVKFLGILSFEDTNVGDQIRDVEGIQLILGMTEVDERNPYLREHALFTIRNLMLENPANQAIITQMDPVGVISENGEVLPLPERLRRSQQNTGCGS